MTFIFLLNSSSLIFKTDLTNWFTLKEHPWILKLSLCCCHLLSIGYLNFHFFKISPISRRSKWLPRILNIRINIFVLEFISSTISTSCFLSSEFREMSLSTKYTDIVRTNTACKNVVWESIANSASELHNFFVFLFRRVRKRLWLRYTYLDLSFIDSSLNELMESIFTLLVLIIGILSWFLLFVWKTESIEAL